MSWDSQYIGRASESRVCHQRRSAESRDGSLPQPAWMRSAIRLAWRMASEMPWPVTASLT
jgi:hypothetical protein